MNEIAIRECTSNDDYGRCLELERAVWQYTDLELVPLHSYVVIRGSGGFTLGAFTPEGEMIGFSLALMARRDGRTCYYSYLLAVIPGYQSQSVGRQLKFAQRDWALSRGIDLMVWTFDPLQALNAHFNINRLGAIARTYEMNYYGAAGSSHLHRGLDTDRFLAEWWLSSGRVADRVVPSEIEYPLPVATVDIPADINSLKVQDPEAAREWQLRVRRQCREHFASGLYVGGVEPAPDGNSYRYLLYRQES
jgi:predicted GNAT superfamily acetyltransferase